MVLSIFFSEIDCAERIRLVRKSPKSELSSRFSGRLKIFIGLGSLYSLEPIFQNPHYRDGSESTKTESKAAASESRRDASDSETEMILGFASRYACLGDLDKWAASRLQVACK